MQKYFSIIILFPIILSIILSSIFIPSIVNELGKSGINVQLVSSNLGTTGKTNNILYTGISSFSWPTPNYKIITSSFGYRVAPATGASSYHGGIDIGAPQGTPILAIQNGIISFAGWNGANGYTVKIIHQDGYESTYGHVNPNLIVKKGEQVMQNQVIAYVGPKYIEPKAYTTYKDPTRRTNKWSYYRPAFTFCNFEGW